MPHFRYSFSRQVVNFDSFYTCLLVQGRACFKHVKIGT